MNNERMLGVAGIVLVIVGSILLGQGGGMLLLGLVALLAGVGLVVRMLLRLTETSSGGSTSYSIASNRDGAPSPGDYFSLKGIKRMAPTSQWTAGALMGIVALLGLFLFSRAGDGMFALFGGVLFLFGLAVIVVFVHQATDYSSPAEPEAEAPAKAPEPAAETTTTVKAEEAKSAA